MIHFRGDDDTFPMRTPADTLLSLVVGPCQAQIGPEPSPVLVRRRMEVRDAASGLHDEEGTLDMARRFLVQRTRDTNHWSRYREIPHHPTER
jgi:hypothetical protein